mmetsp:Transcript_60343/g.173138  ORF Transcript_60343/g.173138 Transcript_60343/m.173138 type:complete len:94 (-) Transcript_60343:430-711(-)
MKQPSMQRLPPSRPLPCSMASADSCAGGGGRCRASRTTDSVWFSTLITQSVQQNCRLRSACASWVMNPQNEHLFGDANEKCTDGQLSLGTETT